jgi:hypothetical protein
MGSLLFLALALPAIAFVIGGVLIRGQASVRGVRWWLGWVLFVGGGLAFGVAYVLMFV